MSDNQKLTGIIIDGVVYKVEQKQKCQKCACDLCDIHDYCKKHHAFGACCVECLKNDEYFKKGQQ